MNKYSELKKISIYAGIRFDLVQAGGGNSSVKLDESSMLVKASGINLSQVTADTGYVEVEYQKIRNWFRQADLSGMSKKERESEGNALLSSVTVSKQGKPSIETFLHALLKTYTLHTHPVSVNTIASQNNWQEIFLREFPDSICVSYATPGIDLALSLYAGIKDKADLPQIVFLQNHGLIVSCDNSDEVIEITEMVTHKLNDLMSFDLKRYQNITKLQKMIQPYWPDTAVIYCSDDTVISNLLSTETEQQHVWPFCPDTLIYCGVEPVYISSLEDDSAYKDYSEKYSEPAKVMVFDGQVYFIANNLKKAKESEELMKFHLLVLSKNTETVNRLSIEEIAYLSNWDAEKYRQGV